ncbi:hypothetical protein [Nocardia sp. NPDC050793]|uniref:hypothetical protein n=1 Tax=Nocardia sp. NPDC050793 TaxID=3155159 RepID=UPI0033D547FF
MSIAKIDPETWKALLTFVFVAVLGGAVGLLWATIRHRKELDREALSRFHDVYGAWFVVWKTWSAMCEGKVRTATREDLLERAAATEGQFEALLIKIATERRLSNKEIERLGRFREGYQQLRNTIEAGATVSTLSESNKLPFKVRGNLDEIGPYIAFKMLAVEFARLVEGQTGLRRLLPRPTRKSAEVSFIKVTSWRPVWIPPSSAAANAPESSWWLGPGGDSVAKAVEAWERITYPRP